MSKKPVPPYQFKSISELHRVLELPKPKHPLVSVIGTQQHIHDKLIEKAKAILATTSLSVAEIAYRLGFEHPQSFHKLFKAKVNTSPLEFRQRFN